MAETTTDVSETLVEELERSMPCDPCMAFGLETSATWIVIRPSAPHNLLCDPCLRRWIKYGFSTAYNTDATWVRL